MFFLLPGIICYVASLCREVADFFLPRMTRKARINFARDGTEIKDYLSQMTRISRIFFATDGTDFFLESKPVPSLWG